MNNEELTRGFCKFCQKNSKYKERLSLLKDRKDLYTTEMIVHIMIASYRATLIPIMSISEYMKARAFLEQRAPIFAENILNSFKDI